MRGKLLALSAVALMLAVTLILAVMMMVTVAPAIVDA